MKKILTKVKNFFNDINFCHEVKSNGEHKGPSFIMNIMCFLFWPLAQWYYDEDPRFCWCCTAVRGIIYGGIAGFIIGYIIWGVIL